MIIYTLIFTMSLFMVFFAYLGYPLSLIAIRIFRKKPLIRERITPSVTLIITAFNEEKRIKDKLVNSLQLEYPSKLLQIMIASDGSTDNTNDIVRSFANRGIVLLEVENRGGKEKAQKEAVYHAVGEIIIFSDVATIIEPQGILEIVSNFADPSIGCVSSQDRLIGQDGQPGGEGAYVKYEMWLRSLESEVNSLVGLSGSFFAARREVCQDFSGEVQSDFRTLLSSMKLGLRGVSDPNAIGSYLDIADEKREFQRKVRTVLRGMTVFFKHSDFLYCTRYGLFSYQYFCHKLLRWLVPFFLITAFMANVVLSFCSTLFFFFLIGQVCFYGLALYGLTSKRLKGMLKVPMYFLVVNSAIVLAWFQYLNGKRVVLWTPSER